MWQRALLHPGIVHSGVMLTATPKLLTSSFPEGTRVVPACMLLNIHRTHAHSYRAPLPTGLCDICTERLAVTYSQMMQWKACRKALKPLT
jgi:hypothetical protein